MNLSFRHIGALLALIALTVGTVQGLWASTCVMEMSVVTTASTEAAAPFSGCPHGMSAVSTRVEASQEEGGPDAPRCPFMPMGVTGSCGTAMALSAQSPVSMDLSPGEILLPPFPKDVRDLLLVAPFFRPPIA